MILSLVFLAAALFIFFDLIQPTYGDLQTKKATVLSNQTLFDHEQQVVAQAKKLISQYENESLAENNLALAMPTGPNVAMALAEVYGIAQNNNIVIQNVGINPPTVQVPNQAQRGSASTSVEEIQIIKPTGALSLQITAIGSYENFKNFFSQLETNIRVFDLTTLSTQAASGIAIGGKGAQVTPDFFTYNFTVTTYYQVP